MTCRNHRVTVTSCAALQCPVPLSCRCRRSPEIEALSIESNRCNQDGPCTRRTFGLRQRNAGIHTSAPLLRHFVNRDEEQVARSAARSQQIDIRGNEVHGCTGVEGRRLTVFKYAASVLAPNDHCLFAQFHAV